MDEVGSGTVLPSSHERIRIVWVGGEGMKPEGRRGVVGPHFECLGLMMFLKRNWKS